MGAAVGLGAVAWGEFGEEEAGAFGDVPGVPGGVGAGGVLEAGGVLDGEAIGVEGVGGDGFLVGEAEAVVGGFLLLASPGHLFRVRCRTATFTTSSKLAKPPTGD